MYKCDRAESVQKYSAAAYLRLSREDTQEKPQDIKCGFNFCKAAESSSIETQREMIFEYIRESGDICLYDVYSDDGWSGTDFERPEFKRMLSDIYSGRVNCVIVKDLSRLGRDYIETGRLLQKTFPLLGVRFISITDCFDSLTADFNETSLVLPLKNFINDAYAKDISDKVRSHQLIKRKNGQFTGAFAVYGYRKSRENHNRLEADEYAANIVKKIFAWKLIGLSNLFIAERLNEKGIMCPLEYKRIHGERLESGFAVGENMKWSAVAVKRVLTDETYIGNLAQGKTQRINYKIKRSVKKPESEWIRAEYTHQPVIEKTYFYRVQDLLNLKLRTKSGEAENNPYIGIMFCGCCKAPMSKRVIKSGHREKVIYKCSAKCKSDAGVYISGDYADKIISQSIIRAAALGGGFVSGKYPENLTGRIDDWSRKYNSEGLKEIECFRREIKALREELGKYIKIQKELLMDCAEGIIGEREFAYYSEKYENMRARLVNFAELQSREERRLVKSHIKAQEKINFVKNSLGEKPETIFGKPDRAMLLSYIKSISVYENKRICIELTIRREESEKQ